MTEHADIIIKYAALGSLLTFMIVCLGCASAAVIMFTINTFFGSNKH